MRLDSLHQQSVVSESMTKLSAELRTKMCLNVCGGLTLERAIQIAIVSSLNNSVQSIFESRVNKVRQKLYGNTRRSHEKP